MNACDHNVIPVRVWWRTRWICVRCDRLFREVPPRIAPAQGGDVLDDLWWGAAE